MIGATLMDAGADARSPVASREHVVFCFRTLVAKLSGKVLPEPTFDTSVTWCVPAFADCRRRCVVAFDVRPPARAGRCGSLVAYCIVARNWRSPFFVTFKKRDSDGDYDLRGCIGTLSPRSIADLRYFTVQRYPTSSSSLCVSPSRCSASEVCFSR
jgi:hypothetical protein